MYSDGGGGSSESSPLKTDLERKKRDISDKYEPDGILSVSFFVYVMLDGSIASLGET